jgi:DNA polymerase-1
MKHLLIDANNLMYRAYFASKLTDSKGNRISGAFNSMRMLSNLMKKFKPDSVVVAWDLGKSKRRLQLYPEYKQQRDKNRNEEDKINIAKNKEILIELFKHLPVKQIQVQDIEADDIIGWLATEKLKGEKIIVSNDTDFIQLVGKKVKLYLPKGKRLVAPKGEKSKPYLLGKKSVDKFCGFPVKYYTLWKSLVGDKSDNIVGVHGIGPVKATGIILNGLNEKKKKLKISSEQQLILDRNKYLIAIGAILQDEDIDDIKKEYRKSKKQEAKVRFSQVRKIFRKHNFQSLLYQIDEFEMRFRKITRKVKSGEEEKSTKIKRKEKIVKSKKIIKRKRDKDI